MRYVEAPSTVPQVVLKGQESSLESVGPKRVRAEHAHIIPELESRWIKSRAATHCYTLGISAAGPENPVLFVAGDELIDAGRHALAQAGHP